MITGDVIPQSSATVPSARIQIPQYYYQAASWLEAQTGHFRVLSLPKDQILQSSEWSPGYAGQDISRFLTGESIISAGSQIPDLDAFQSSLYTYISHEGNNLTNILRVMDVRFVLLRMDAGFYPKVTPFANLTELHSYLQGQDNLQLVNQFGPLLFYEVVGQESRVYATSVVLSPSQLNSEGWSLASYLGSWQNQSADISTNSSALELSIASQGTYTYGFATTNGSIDISTATYPYLKVTFSSTSNAALLLAVDFGSQTFDWLTAYDIGSATTYQGNHYSDTNPTTLAYDLSSFRYDVKGIRIFVTNSPDTTSYSEGRIQIEKLSFESFNGLPIDYVRAISQRAQNPLSYVISNQTHPVEYTSNAVTPSIVYDEVSPVEYDVQIRNSASSFVLVLGETYDPLWAITAGPSIDTSHWTHMMVNGFANAWLIDRLGNYSITIRYANGMNVLWAYSFSFLASLAIFVTIVIVEITSKRKPIR